MMTISELKQLNEKNGGHFFRAKTMMFFGDSLSNFQVSEGEKPDTVIVTRKQPKRYGSNKWTFSTKTGRVIH